VQTEDREYRILPLSQFELRQVSKNATQDINNILNKLVLALNTLIRHDMCAYQPENPFNEGISDLEKLFYHAQTILYKYEWPAKLTNKNCGQLYEKIAKINSEYLLKYDESLTCLNKALSIYQEAKIVGNEKVSLLANIYNSIGNLKYQLGKFNEALIYFDQALTLFKSLVPQNLASIATLTNNKGYMHLNMGDYVSAFNEFEKSIEMYRLCVSSDHPYIAVSISNIGLLHFCKGEYVLALKNYEKALGI
jgi:tetratricopeptide (TPR) repeat protein